MALDCDELSVWQIGFRWAGEDPDRFWFRIPLVPRDNFRVLMNAILSGEVISPTLCLDKLPPNSKADPRFYIRTYLEDVYGCIHGRSFNRKLLKWATIDRRDFLAWCNCRGIAPPEFWFPPGWKLKYEHPDDLLPGLYVRHKEPEGAGSLVSFSYDWPNPPDELGELENDAEGENELSDAKLRRNQAAKIACQQIASRMWKKDPSRRIAEVIRDELIQEYGGAKYFNDETVREWIKGVAPDAVRARRGRPRKEKGAGGE